jgi:hypothetical protein
MPGPLFHVGNTTICPHGGQAQTISSNARVLVSGLPVATIADQTVVAGCAFTIPPSKPSPCVRVQWTQPAVRVLIMGQPALLQTSIGLTLSPEQAPQGAPIVAVNQPRVLAT